MTIKVLLHLQFVVVTTLKRIKLFLSGGSLPTAEAFIYNHTLVVLELLDMGLSYEVIHSMEEQEANRLLGARYALKERQQEMEEAQARQQQSSRSSF